VGMTIGSDTGTSWRTHAGPVFQAVTRRRDTSATQSGRCRDDLDILYEFLSSSAGISVMATSNLDWILSRISISVALETKVRARPLVPKRPARLSWKKLKLMARMWRKRHAPNTMQVAICVPRSVVVDDDIDSLNVNTTAEDVGGDKYTLLEILELRITGDATTNLDERPAT